MLNLSTSAVVANLTTLEPVVTDHPRQLYQTVLAVIFLLVTVFIAFFGNIAVIAVIFLYRTLRQDISNMLLVNLSITDLANTVFIMMSALVSLIMDEWPYGSFWCDCVCAINYCLIIVSMLTLCEISVDRYQAVMHPLSYISRVTRPRLFAAIIYTWIQGMAFGLVPSVLKWVSYDYWEAICAIQWHLHRPPSLIYVIMAFVMCFLGPGIVLVYCYVKILQEVKQQKGQVVHMAPSTDKNKKKQRASETDRIMWSLIVVVFAYFICTTPFSLTKLIKVSVDNQKIIPGSINLTASLLGYVASAVNPLVYGIFRRDFRKAYIRLFKATFLGQRFLSSVSQTNIRQNASVTLSASNAYNASPVGNSRSVNSSPQPPSHSLRRKALHNSTNLLVNEGTSKPKVCINGKNQTATTGEQLYTTDTTTAKDKDIGISDHTESPEGIAITYLKPDNTQLNGNVPTDTKNFHAELEQKLEMIQSQENGSGNDSDGVEKTKSTDTTQNVGAASDQTTNPDTETTSKQCIESGAILDTEHDIPNGKDKCEKHVTHETDIEKEPSEEEVLEILDKVVEDNEPEPDATTRKTSITTNLQDQITNKTKDDLWNNVIAAKAITDKTDECLGSVISCRHILVHPTAQLL